MALVTTPGAANANSFATVAEFKTYRDARLPVNATAAAATDSEIEAALIMSARSMDDTFPWTGAATDPDVQALTWPRTGMLNRNGGAIAEDVNPQALKDAQCEWAYQLLAGNDTTSDDEASKKGISSVKAGSVAVTFQTKSVSTIEAADIQARLAGDPALFYLNAPAEVRRLLVPSWYIRTTIKQSFVFKSY